MGGSRLAGLAAVILGLVPTAARAWGGLGHRAVALIAEHRLSPKAEEQVQRLLGPSYRLADIATCADDIKRRGERCGPFVLKAAPRSKSWHFIDIPIQASPTAATLKRYCVSHGRSDQCCPEQVREDLATLKDPAASTRDKQMALMYLVHFVGDLHQPLHNADDGDHGGNAKLVWFLQSKRSHKKTNLHHIWDNMLVKDSQLKKFRPDAFAAELERRITPSEAQAWTRGDVVSEAALESFQIAKTRIYPAYDPDTRLSVPYQQELQPIALEQVAKAGVRLAYLLDGCWP
ncbi:MAG: hypothetical protein NTX64_03715 [Elusimicrobia bacterium]|nr:hypothetical protein [Elusimicrobiota bacterium]